MVIIYLFKTKRKFANNEKRLQSAHSQSRKVPFPLGRFLHNVTSEEVSATAVMNRLHALR